MPKAYVILTEAIKDPSGIAQYGKAAAAAMTGGTPTILAVDPAPQVLEGDWHGDQTVILEFDSVEAARGGTSRTPTRTRSRCVGPPPTPTRRSSRVSDSARRCTSSAIK
jgi:uncharacterized protein (DUF1330 family)